MSTQVQYRRGSSSQVAAFTGALGELVIDTTNKIVVVNDGATAGGFPQVGLTATQTLTNKIYQGTSASVTGNVTGGNILTGGLISSTGNITGGNIIGTIVGTISTTSASVSGNITGGNILTGGLITATGTITGANITGSNILTGGLISATGTITGANITGANLLTSGVVSAGGNITGGNLTTAGILTVNSGGAATAIVNGAANAVGNIGSSSSYFNTVFAKATSAQYADLAEMYCADAKYAPGTVVEFGGDHEITITTETHSTRVAGIISTNPSYLMNSTLECENSLEVALVGRVPCQVVGTIRKGDRLVSSTVPGTAQALNTNLYEPGCIIGKALEDYNSNTPGVIEVAVGRN
jgi:trimeric autotransporter adhesin